MLPRPGRRRGHPRQPEHPKTGAVHGIGGAKGRPLRVVAQRTGQSAGQSKATSVPIPRSPRPDRSLPPQSAASVAISLSPRPASGLRPESDGTPGPSSSIVMRTLLAAVATDTRTAAFGACRVTLSIARVATRRAALGRRAAANLSRGRRRRPRRSSLGRLCAPPSARPAIRAPAPARRSRGRWRRVLPSSPRSAGAHPAAISPSDRPIPPVRPRGWRGADPAPRPREGRGRGGLARPSLPDAPASSRA